MILQDILIKIKVDSPYLLPSVDYELMDADIIPEEFEIERKISHDYLYSYMDITIINNFSNMDVSVLKEDIDKFIKLKYGYLLSYSIEIVLRQNFDKDGTYISFNISNTESKYAISKLNSVKAYRDYINTIVSEKIGYGLFSIKTHISTNHYDTVSKVTCILTLKEVVSIEMIVNILRDIPFNDKKSLLDITTEIKQRNSKGTILRLVNRTKNASVFTGTVTSRDVFIDNICTSGLYSLEYMLYILKESSRQLKKFK